MNNPKSQSQRWVWFLDVVFGAIVALGIQKYEPVLREAWVQGIGPLALSLFVSVSICSFVVYDIAVYHALANKYRYGVSLLGFVRFYLDLVMAFLLYVLLVNAFQSRPDWVPILGIVSSWHLAAILWHLLALREHRVAGRTADAVGTHLMLIVVYWGVIFFTHEIGVKLLDLAPGQLSTLLLVTAAGMILLASILRWREVIQKITGDGGSEVQL